ncbi:unnamed protein product [Macrosiphum euphorbiae]|uniref:C2H2-type domain-containing protein n=1 Tax=Macrosiphum euphorbiae TaxID=13131 RepID=A0AAV0WVK2_9HEMI|nr:unnamed protein product [Macrosiphum euphorbiae]
MFKCVQCPSVFVRKDSLVRHEITHKSIRFPCTVCPSTFSQKSHLNRHLKNVHGIVNIPTHLRPIPAARNIDHPTRAPRASNQGDVIQIAPQIFIPDVPAGGSNAISDDDILCMEAMDEFEDNDLLCMKAMNEFEDTG